MGSTPSSRAYKRGGEPSEPNWHRIPPKKDLSNKNSKLDYLGKGRVPIAGLPTTKLKSRIYLGRVENQLRVSPLQNLSQEYLGRIEANCGSPLY